MVAVAVIVAAIGCADFKDGRTPAPADDASPSDSTTLLDAVSPADVAEDETGAGLATDDAANDGNSSTGDDGASEADARSLDATIDATADDGANDVASRDATVTPYDASDAWVGQDAVSADATDGPQDASDANVDATDAQDAPADYDGSDGGADATTGPPTDFRPMGFVRSDGGTSVVYRNTARDVSEFERTGLRWTGPNDLSRIAGAPVTAASQAVGYVRADGTNVVVYRGTDNDIYELSLSGSVWYWSSLSINAGATPGIAVGDPAAYVRSDGISVVVYRTSSNTIHELALVPGRWIDSDLSAVTAAPLAANDPIAYVRSDQVSSVVFRGMDNHVYELFYMGGGWYPAGDLSQISNAPPAQGKPHPYVRSDNVNAVVFLDSVNAVPAVWEIALVSGTWISSNLTANSSLPTLAVAGDPMPYARSDGFNVVVCRGTTGDVFELALTPPSNPPWTVGDLSTMSGAPPAASDPMGYVRGDGVNAVVFRSSGDNHIREIALGSGGWNASDLGGP